MDKNWIPEQKKLTLGRYGLFDPLHRQDRIALLPGEDKRNLRHLIGALPA